jgi:small-conductance mechanosensitive channel
LNNKVVNYNLSARDLSRALILQTTITLGYDVPWRQAHATLIAAALASEHILREPPPFVLQTNLGNDAISYQLNAYTTNPNLMVLIYSELHQHIQDQCAAHGIEILSPTYASLRDGSASTIPAAERR